MPPWSQLKLIPTTDTVDTATTDTTAMDMVMDTAMDMVMATDMVIIWVRDPPMLNQLPKLPLKPLPPLISAPKGLRNILTLVMSWWGPTKVLTMIWAHLLIFVRCGLVILMLQAMLLLKSRNLKSLEVALVVFSPDWRPCISYKLA